VRAKAKQRRLELGFRRIHELHKANGPCYTAQGTLAVFAVFAANYQPSTSPSRRKSWAADGLASARTAATPAVLLLFLAVLVGKIQEPQLGHYRRIQVHCAE